MRKIGYCRVGSSDQNPKRQIVQLEEVGCEIIYQVFYGNKVLY